MLSHNSTVSIRHDARRALQPIVEKVIADTPLFDIHTHLYAPAFGDLLLFGLDEMLTYHYLVAEVFRHLKMPYDAFWEMTKTQQADLVWQHLFLEHSPLSEACRGVLTTLQSLGLDVKQRDLASVRRWFAAQNVETHVARCMEIANVGKICMTNSPFDKSEVPTWIEYSKADDTRFVAALRIDPLLNDWENTCAILRQDGYRVQTDLGAQTFSEVRRFLSVWADKMAPLYAMVSLPPNFVFPATSTDNATFDDLFSVDSIANNATSANATSANAASANAASANATSANATSANENAIRARLIEHAVLPFCRERNLPFALMLGVRRALNPDLRLAGDGVGRSDLGALQNLLARFPDNKFLATVLSRENQHELAVLARKHRNLHVFGCWWFLNTMSLVEETTKMRLELLGLSFTPQHSDARVFDQIIYKWDHSRAVIGEVLLDKYSDLAASGWTATPGEIERDVQQLFGGAFENFLQR